MDRGTALEKKGSQPNPQHDGWPIHGSIPSFSHKTTIEAVGIKPPSVDGSLLGLPGPYFWHAIGTFNTFSRGPTHRSLTDTNRGYNLKGVGFPHHTLQPSQPIVLRFPPEGLIRSQVIQHQHKPLVKVLWSTYHRPVVFRLLSVYRSLYLHIAMANVIQILARSSRVTQNVFIMHLRFQPTRTNLMHNSP
jgi:hypothetical protein